MIAGGHEASVRTDGDIAHIRMGPEPDWLLRVVAVPHLAARSVARDRHDLAVRTAVDAGIVADALGEELRRADAQRPRRRARLNRPAVQAGRRVRPEQPRRGYRIEPDGAPP